MWATFVSRQVRWTRCKRIRKGDCNAAWECELRPASKPSMTIFIRENSFAPFMGMNSAFTSEGSDTETVGTLTRAYLLAFLVCRHQRRLDRLVRGLDASRIGTSSGIGRAGSPGARGGVAP
jgi:hypothetical protein